MADLSKIKLPNDETYDLKDTVARTALGGHIVGKDVPADAVFTDIGVPDVNLLMEYSTYQQTSTKNTMEYGLGGMCYIGNGHYVFYVRVQGVQDQDYGRLVCVKHTVNPSDSKDIQKEFVWRTAPIKAYHANTLAYYDGSIYMCATETDAGTYKEECYKFTPTEMTTYQHQNDAGNATVTEQVMGGNFLSQYNTSFKGGNLAYDRTTQTFYSSVGRHLSPGENAGDIYQWTGAFTGNYSVVSNLLTANQNNQQIVDLLNTAWYQGCHVEDGIFYQILWRDRSMILAFDVNTGKYIKGWNIPNKSNFCKVMNEIQDLTYNWDREEFLFASTTYTARISQPPVVNISEIGLYHNLNIMIPSRTQALISSQGSYNNCFQAHIEMGANSYTGSFGPLRNDCTPCCDRYNKQGKTSSDDWGVQYNRFRSIKDADYAFQCSYPGGGKIKYIFENSFSSAPVVVSTPPFFKPCIITNKSGQQLTLISPFFSACSDICIQGQSDTYPITIQGDGLTGQSGSVIKLKGGNRMELEHVRFNTGSPSTVSYGVFVQENAMLTLGTDVLLDTSFTASNKKVAYYQNAIFTAASGIIIVNQHWMKVGNIIVGNLAFYRNSAISTTTVQVGTVLFPPPYQVIGNARNSSTQMRCSINTSGVININSPSSVTPTSSNPIYMNFSYAI